MSRSTWEILQSGGGYNYTQLRNIGGYIDRVDYFGGATFATDEYSRVGRQGVSLGNYINMDINDAIEGNFADRVISDPLFMHEYGHTFDSRRNGLLYLFNVGLPSANSVRRRQPVPGGDGVSTHDFQWYEMSANRHAARYFGRYYGVDWNTASYEDKLFKIYYPLRRR